MKTVWLVVGIVLIFACVVSFLIAVLNWFGYYHVLDGEAELYAAMHRRAIVFGAIGIVLAAVGTACLVLRSGM